MLLFFLNSHHNNPEPKLTSSNFFQFYPVAALTWSELYSGVQPHSTATDLRSVCQYVLHLSRTRVWYSTIIAGENILGNQQPL